MYLEKKMCICFTGHAEVKEHHGNGKYWSMNWNAFILFFMNEFYCCCKCCIRKKKSTFDWIEWVICQLQRIFVVFCYQLTIHRIVCFIDDYGSKEVMFVTKYDFFTADNCRIELDFFHQSFKRREFPSKYHPLIPSTHFMGGWATSFSILFHLCFVSSLTFFFYHDNLFFKYFFNLFFIILHYIHLFISLFCCLIFFHRSLFVMLIRILYLFCDVLSLSFAS